MRAVAPPLRTYSCDSRMPRLPPVENSAPDAFAREVLAGRRIFGRDFRPVAFELLGDELREAGQRPLPHLGARDADDDGVVRPDDDPCGDLGRAVGGARDTRAPNGRSNPSASPPPIAAEPMTKERRLILRVVIHGRPLLHALAAAWIAARTCWNVPQRQMLVIAASMSASVGFGLLVQQRRRRHDHARLAVAALRHVVLEPGLLHLDAARRSAARPSIVVIFLPARALTGIDARTRRRAVDVHRARAALGDAAAVFGARHADPFAQHPQQGRVGSASTSCVFPLTVRFAIRVAPQSKTIGNKRPPQSGLNLWR